MQISIQEYSQSASKSNNQLDNYERSKEENSRLSILIEDLRIKMVDKDRYIDELKGRVEYERKHL